MANVSMRPLDSGELTQRITFQQRADGADALGQALEAWEDIANVPSMYAKAITTGSREVTADGQLQVVTEVEFHTRFRDDILPSMRVLWRGQPHEILAEPIDPDSGRHRLIILTAKGMRGGR